LTEESKSCYAKNDRGRNLKRDKIIEILHLPSSPNPFSQTWEKGSRSTKRSLLLPLPSLGEGRGEGKYNSVLLKTGTRLDGKVATLNNSDSQVASSLENPLYSYTDVGQNSDLGAKDLSGSDQLENLNSNHVAVSSGNNASNNNLQHQGEQVYNKTLAIAPKDLTLTDDQRVAKALIAANFDAPSVAAVIENGSSKAKNMDESVKGDYAQGVAKTAEANKEAETDKVASAGKNANREIEA
jgi:hypothetical protein